jgi:hypothetical protein
VRLRRPRPTLSAPLSLLPEARVFYRMKRPMAGGHDELVLQPLEFLRKLATLVPPPRKHMIRFHCVFAPNSSREKSDSVVLSTRAPVRMSGSLAKSPAACSGERPLATWGSAAQGAL